MTNLLRSRISGKRVWPTLIGCATFCSTGILGGPRLTAIRWRLELPAIRLPEDEAG